MPESRVRDLLGELVRTRVGGVTLAHNRVTFVPHTDNEIKFVNGWSRDV